MYLISLVAICKVFIIILILMFKMLIRKIKNVSYQVIKTLSDVIGKTKEMLK